MIRCMVAVSLIDFCGGSGTVKVRGRVSGRILYVCDRCASDWSDCYERIA